MDTVLFTRHHFGWRTHDFTSSSHDHLVAALLETHGFLAEYENSYRVQVERTPDCSFDGSVLVFWDREKPHTLIGVPPLRKGDFWFRAFDFNVAPNDACAHCGGTGIDHYSGPFFHCWACDGTTKKIRSSMPQGFQKKRVEASPSKAEGRTNG